VVGLDVAEILRGVEEEWISGEEDFEIDFVEIDLKTPHILISHLNLSIHQFTVYNLLFFSHFVLFFLLIILDLLIFDQHFAVVLGQLIRDVDEQFSPGEDWVREIILADISGSFEVGIAGVKIEISRAIVILQLMVMSTRPDLGKSLDGFLDTVLEQQVVGQEEELASVGFRDFCEVDDEFFIFLAKLLVEDILLVL